MIQGMPCPECGDMNAPVRHSGHDVGGNRVRRRDCGNCGHRFTTVEVPVDASFFRLVQATRETKAYPHSVDPDVIVVRMCRVSGLPEITVRRGKVRAKRCRRGLHILTAENTIQWRSKAGQCRLCYNDTRRETYHAKRSMGMRRLADGSWQRQAAA